MSNEQQKTREAATETAWNEWRRGSISNLEDESLRLQADPDCPMCEGIGTVPYGSMQVPCPECVEKGK